MNFGKKDIETIENAINFVNIKRNVKYHVDHKTGVVVAIRNTKKEGTQIGVARCNNGDKFVKPIGMAIATYRSMNKSVPNDLLRFPHGR